MYLQTDPEFSTTLKPYIPGSAAPPIAKKMAAAVQKAEVGLAGAFAETIGKYLITKYKLTDLIIENGGDIFLNTIQPRKIAIWAGNFSKLSNKLALDIPPASAPLGICTSSGTPNRTFP